MTEQEITDKFYTELMSDISDKDDIKKVKPFLAHYTTLDVLESVLRNNEIWRMAICITHRNVSDKGGARVNPFWSETLKREE